MFISEYVYNGIEHCTINKWPGWLFQSTRGKYYCGLPSEKLRITDNISVRTHTEILPTGQDICYGSRIKRNRWILMFSDFHFYFMYKNIMHPSIFFTFLKILLIISLLLYIFVKITNNYLYYILFDWTLFVRTVHVRRLTLKVRRRYRQ